jgi:hypothetical protein
MNPTPLETEVKEFVARITSVRPDKLAPGTRLAQDIGVDGDDGDDLMAAFGKQFGVDLSEFRTDSHFGQEGNAFAYLLGLAGSPRTWSSRLRSPISSRRRGLVVGSLRTVSRFDRPAKVAFCFRIGRFVSVRRLCS